MMTSKERWLAAISFQPVDRLPFWPKIFGGYPIYQKQPFSNMKINQIQNWIGSDNHIGIKSCVKETSKRCSVNLQLCTKL